MEPARPKHNVKKTIVNIGVIGIGRAGIQTLANIPKEQLASIRFLYADADPLLLEQYPPEQTIWLGDRDFNEALGGAGTPTLGRLAAQNATAALKRALAKTRLLILTGGLGGATATGALPVVGQIARELGILTVALVTLPFAIEGTTRKAQAQAGLQALREHVDAYVVVSNDKLLNLYPDLVMVDAFQLTNNVLKNCIKALTDLMLKTSLINLDFADLQQALQNRGETHLSFGSGLGPNKVARAIAEALQFKFIDAPVKTWSNVVVNIVADASVSLHQADEISQRLRSQMPPTATLVFGFDVNPQLKNEVRITILATASPAAAAATAASSDPEAASMHDTLIRIGNTLELELSGQQPLEPARGNAEELSFLNDELGDENILIEADENDDEVPFFLK